jgi:alpha-L-fucosidase
MKKILILSFLTCVASLLAAQNSPKPTPQQLAWHDMEFYLFMHFGPNTFTGLEWGHGNEKEEIFNPTNLDCEQWCRIAKASGAKGIIITAKHHDGFCLWPSKFSTHTVRESKWKEGKGDVLKELSAACKKYGLKFGVYISPWDRNHPDYGTSSYNDVFVNMMKELFTNYGPIWELWWDGANGEGPNGKKQLYDWNRFEQTVRKLSPNTLVFSDIGPDIRWCGNESGIAGTSNWNTLDTAGFTRGAGSPPQDTLNAGNVNGKHWIPAECDVSIRPGWFYHKAEDGQVKTPEQLFNLYLKSVGRGANLLLNVPPDGRGFIHENDSAALIGFRKLSEENFKMNIAKKAEAYFIPHNGLRSIPFLNDGKTDKAIYMSEGLYQSCYLEFEKEESINCIILHENIIKGQKSDSFQVVLSNKKGEVTRLLGGTTIGNKRIITFPKSEISRISFYATNKNEYTQTGITEIEAYLIDEKLIEK